MNPVISLAGFFLYFYLSINNRHMKYLIRLLIPFCIILLLTTCKQKDELTEKYSPPAWSENAIWYQIFVERFNNGDTSNDPKPENIRSASDFRPVPESWGITPWIHNWYKQEEWAKAIGADFYGGLQMRRFGGDLQGVYDKLDYLQELGINAIYFNPINDAPSLHKFDARNYRHIDVNFGPDPIGDNEIIASEDPADPTSWKWTSADQLFLKLVDEIHKRGMRVIVDFSWNHTGVEFWAWKDILKNQEKSIYKDWYNIVSYDNPETEENEFDYHGWLNLKSLPELKKVNLTTERKIGHPYEGDINEGAKKHIYAVTKRWLAPDGDINKGIDGYRLDVADHIGMGFWRDWHKYVKSINPEAYLVGEIWWEKWPDQLMDPEPWVNENIFDAIMFYQVYRPARYFFAKTDFEIDAAQLKDSLLHHWSKIPSTFQHGMMNTAATHDSPRLLSSFNNTNKYKYNAKPDADPSYKTGKPGKEAVQRARLYLIHQFTSIGAPQIWNGDEMGMWGGDDPDCRKPLWWPEFEFEPEYSNSILNEEKTYNEVSFNKEHFNFYKKLIKIRKDNRVLQNGEFTFLLAEGKKLMYKRTNATDEIIVIFNLENTEQEFNLGKGTNYIDLLGSNHPVSESVRLSPLSAIVCKKAN
jgi:glycosidase